MFKVGDKVYIPAVITSTVLFGGTNFFELGNEVNPEESKLGMFAESWLVARTELNGDGKTRFDSEPQAVADRFEKPLPVRPTEPVVWRLKCLKTGEVSFVNKVEFSETWVLNKYEVTPLYEGENGDLNAAPPATPHIAAAHVNTKIHSSGLTTDRIGENPQPAYERSSSPVPPPAQDGNKIETEFRSQSQFAINESAIHTAKINSAEIKETLKPELKEEVERIADKAVGTLKIEIDENLEQRIKDIIKNSRYGIPPLEIIDELDKLDGECLNRIQCGMNNCIEPCDICGKGCLRIDGTKVGKGFLQKLKEAFSIAAPMPIEVGDDGCSYIAGVSFGQAPLKPYEETQGAKLDAIGSLASILDVTDDHVASVMLRETIKQILERDFKIVFETKKSEKKPHIPQPRNP